MLGHAHAYPNAAHAHSNATHGHADAQPDAA
jgi:hypothetical protein